jgi:hypothetical protein
VEPGGYGPRRGFFERLLAADFVATGGRTVRTKADYIAGIRDTTDGPRTRATLSETRVRLLRRRGCRERALKLRRDAARAPPLHGGVRLPRGAVQAVHGHYNTLRDTTAR